MVDGMEFNLRMARRIRPSDYIRKHWLLFGILGCIFLALLYPKFGAKNGPLKPEYSVKYGAVTIIFLISGLSLKTESMYYTLRQHKLHLFVQIYTFIFIPLFMQVVVQFLSLFDVNTWILKGLITVACMPPPVSTAVILTRSAQGNETAAIFNSVLGSFLGIIVTPVSLLFNLGYTTIIPIFGTVFQLSVTVLFPLLLGQAIRKYTDFKGHTLPLSSVGQIALLFVIYTTFCDTFLAPETGLLASDILVTVFVVLIVQIILMYVSFNTARSFKKCFSPNDVIAICFCSTHKSLTLGIPILRIMFHGFSHLSQISLPLLVYHPTQIILGGLAVTQMKEWVHMNMNKRPPV